MTKVPLANPEAAPNDPISSFEIGQVCDSLNVRIEQLKGCPQEEWWSDPEACEEADRLARWLESLRSRLHCHRHAIEEATKGGSK